MLQNIQLHYKKQLTPRRSLIIFDEVQKCPRAREAIKALVEDGLVYLPLYMTGVL